jgi:hypothetical protein
MMGDLVALRAHKEAASKRVRPLMCDLSECLGCSVSLLDEAHRKLRAGGFLTNCARGFAARISLQEFSRLFAACAALKVRRVKRSEITRFLQSGDGVQLQILVQTAIDAGAAFKWAYSAGSATVSIEVDACAIRALRSNFEG